MLCVAQNQKNTIESVSESIAEAEKYTCWNPMLLKKDDEAIGFAMYGVWVDTNKPPRMWLDRFFIDQRYQKKVMQNKYCLGYWNKFLLCMMRCI